MTFFPRAARHLALLLPMALLVPSATAQQAPPAPVHNGAAYWFKISAQQDGTFTVSNTRNGFSKTYRPGN